MQKQTGTGASRMAAVLLVLLIGTSGSASLLSNVGEFNPFGSLFSILDSVLPHVSVSVSGTPHDGVTTELSQTLPNPAPASSQTASEVQTETPAGPSLPITGLSTPIVTIIPSWWAGQSRKRSRFEVYVEILELLKRGPLTPFEVAFYARLNHKRTKEYIGFLEQSGYVTIVNEDGRIVCVLSASGANVVERARAVYGLFFGKQFASRRAKLETGGT
jgi:predicted transcriptional regulator